jgi:hypothetical protein
MMDEPKVFADFQNTDAQGRVRLNTTGTTRDLTTQQVSLREGLILQLYDHDEDGAGNPLELQVVGKVSFSQDEQCWVASVDWSKLVRASSVTQNGVPA